MRGKKHRNTENVSMVSRTWVSDIVARLTWNDAEKADCAGSKMQPEDWKDHRVTLRPRCNLQHHHNVGAASPSVSQKGDPDTPSPPDDLLHSMQNRDTYKLVLNKTKDKQKSAPCVGSLGDKGQISRRLVATVSSCLQRRVQRFQAGRKRRLAVTVPTLTICCGWHGLFW